MLSVIFAGVEAQLNPYLKRDYKNMYKTLCFLTCSHNWNSIVPSKTFGSNGRILIGWKSLNQAKIRNINKRRITDGVYTCNTLILIS